METQLIRPTEYKNERADCTIRAFVLVTEIPYEKVYEYFENKGRKKCKGFHIQTTDIKKYDKKYNTRTKKVKIPEIAKYFGYTAKQIARSGTSNKLIKRYPKGKIYCVKRGHCFAIIDGIIKDETSYNSILKNAWLITKNNNHTPQGEEIKQNENNDKSIELV